MTRWQRQFDDINGALLGLALSGTIQTVIDRLEGDQANEEPPAANRPQ